jgi:hypothetical protein
MRYFQKIYPNQPLILTNGNAFRRFEVTQDPQIGVYATENPKLLGEFEQAMSAQIGGVKEITQAEYEALKKKAAPKNLNEAFSPSKLAKLKADADRAGAERAARTVAPAPVTRVVRKPTIQNGGSFRPGTVDR